MKVTKEFLYNIMVQEAVRKCYQAKIIDKKAMIYEIEMAVSFYEGVL